MTPKKLPVLAIPFLLAMLGCPGDATAPAVASVSVALDETSIFVGQTTTASASVKDEAGSPLDRAVTWTSGTTSVATINATGVVTAVGAGSSVITATSEGKTGQATITVVAPVATVTVTLASGSIDVGATTQATAVLKDASGNTLGGRTVTWSSSATSVATVNSSGLITGLSQGSATISATVEGKTGSASLTVVVPLPGSFSLSGPANRSASNSTTPDFSWGSSSGATSYTVEVATTSSFGTSNVINQTGITTNSFTPTTGLQPLTVYFWRVTAVNAGGSTVASNGPLELSTVLSAGRDPAGIAITPDGAKAYVVNSTGTGTVTVINLATKQVAGTIPIGGFGGSIVMRPDGAEAVAAASATLYVIDVATNTVSKTIPMPCVATTLYGMAYTPDGARIVLPDLSNGCTIEGMRTVTIANGTSTFIDLSTNTVPQGIAVMPNANSALITLGVTGTAVKRVNLSTGAVTTITGTGATFGVAITPDNASAVVGGWTEGIKRIDLGTNSVSTPLTFSGSEIAITPDGAKAVATGDFSTAVVQLSNNTVLATFPNGSSRVAITADGKYALLTTGAGSGTSGTVRIIRIP
jgi:YVTN family beta-propeller protein